MNGDRSRRGLGGMASVLRAEYLLPLACAAAAICVAASEFMTLFEFDRGTSGETLETIGAAERHFYSLLILALFALVALGVAVVSGSRPAAMAVAAAGGLALLIFLLVDLPDVNREGALDDPSFQFLTSKAEPADGFWFEMVGTIGLAASGAALATLRPEQLTLLSSRLRRAERRPESGGRAVPRDDGVAGGEPTDGRTPGEPSLPQPRHRARIKP